MIEDVITIKIKGTIFEEETLLPLFEKEEELFSLVYGKNGSGKTTISRGFTKFKGKDNTQIELFELLNEKHKSIIIPEEEKNSLFVFNEDFVEDNIRIDGDGLNTIIIMGAEKKVDEKIKEIQPAYNDIVKKRLEKEEIVGKYNDNNSTLSPKYYLDKIKNKLKGQDSWALRDALIYEKKQNTSVKDETYKQFINRNPLNTRDELIIMFQEGIKSLEEAKAGTKRIDKKVPIIEKIIDNEVEIIKLLNKKIEKPNLSEREKFIISIFNKENGNERLKDIELHFTGVNKEKCPFCFQKVDEKYASELVESIKKILSKEVEKYIKELEKKKMEKIELDLVPFKEVFSKKVGEVEESLKVLNSTIEEIDNLINGKIQNVYKSVIVKELKLKEKYEDCQKKLNELEEEIKEFNLKATDKNLIINNLITINADIAHYDIKELYKEYLKKCEEKEIEEKKFSILKENEKDLKEQIEKLKQEKKNIKIAMDSINNDLSYIFFSKNRLKIKYENEKYVIYSHEKSVKPENLSVGERNAIALTYFFNSIMENKEEVDVYNAANFLIIDDPISSFDMENRIGVLSYMKYKLGRYLRGNNKSKFLILTHDLQVFYDIRYLALELISSFKNLSESEASKYIENLELKNKKIVKFNINTKNEYTSLLSNIFDYAENISPIDSYSIGNMMRKVMEGFGTFIYKKGISQLSVDQDIMSTFSEEERNYYENLMYRLILNTGSHMKEKVKSMNDMNFFDYISEEEKQRTAKDIIYFLYKLNPLHIKAHLRKKENVEETIESWKNFL